MEQTSDILTIGQYDDSEGNNIETRITLILSIRPDDDYPVGGTLKEPDKTPMLTTAIGFTLFVVYTYALIRPRR